METSSFDDLTRTLGRTLTRRSALRGFVVGASTLVAGGTLLQAEDASARKRRKKGGRKSPSAPGSNTCNTTSGGTCGPAANNCRCANGSAGGGGECVRIPAGAAEPCPPSGACPQGQLCLKASDDVAYCLTPCV